MRTHQLFALALFACTSPAIAQIGTLDVSFSGDGLISTDIGASTFDKGAAVAIQSDGRIVVVGTSGYDKAYDFGAARYLIDGTPDAEFSANGEVFTSVAPTNDQATCVAIQNDGKVLLGGFGLCTEGNCFAMVRYLSDGTLDPDFGIGGIVSTEFTGGYTTEAKAIAVQDDGTILLAGGGIAGFAVVRYLDDGTVDTGFGTDGLATCAFSTGNDRVTGMEVLADGRIILAGYSSGTGSDSICVTRMLDDGTVDPSFGVNGRARASMPGQSTIGQAMDVAPDGAIVVAGYYVTPFSFEPSAMVARFTADGILDDTFNGTGLRDLAVVGSTASILNGVVVQPDGKVLACGSVTTSISDFYVVRLNLDGSDDVTFNSIGGVVTDFTGTTDQANAIALQADGRIVVAGATSAGSEDYNFAVARYLNDVGLSMPDGTGHVLPMLVVPSPASDHATVSFQLSEADVITIDLLDARGALVMRVRDRQQRGQGLQQERISLEGIPDGLYFLSIRGNSTAQLTKLVVQR